MQVSKKGQRRGSGRKLVDKGMKEISMAYMYEYEGRKSTENNPKDEGGAARGEMNCDTTKPPRLKVLHTQASFYNYVAYLIQIHARFVLVCNEFCSFSLLQIV